MKIDNGGKLDHVDDNYIVAMLKEQENKEGRG